jgi:hypothetical protein
VAVSGARLAFRRAAQWSEAIGIGKEETVRLGVEKSRSQHWSEDRVASGARGTEMDNNPFNASQTDGTKSDKSKPDKKTQSDEPIMLPSGGEVRVGYSQSPRSPAEDKNIHSRRPLPVVLEHTHDEE